MEDEYGLIFEQQIIQHSKDSNQAISLLQQAINHSNSFPPPLPHPSLSREESLRWTVMQLLHNFINPLYAPVFARCVLNLSIRNITDSFMLKKKKPTNKQNPKPKKRVQVTLASNYNTEELRIATISSMDLKSFNKTSEIKPTPSQNKKSISRKSTNQSIKPNLVPQSPNFNRLLKDFKDLKLIHENSSKSPASCKYKSNNKNRSKKLSYQTLRSNATTSKNQTQKLQKTLKKLQLTDLFRDELSQLPIASASQPSAIRELVHIAESDSQEVINLLQLRDFCQTATLLTKSQPSQVLKYNNFFKQNKAALKIQHAWKRYRTKRLIERYVYVMKSRLSHRIQNDFEQNHSNLFSTKGGQEMQLNFSENLYDSSEEVPVPNIRQVSSLSQHSSGKSREYEQAIESIKQEQVNKWNEIISIIKQTNCNNPNDIERLFATITQKSEMNRKHLEVESGKECHQNQLEISTKGGRLKVQEEPRKPEQQIIKKTVPPPRQVSQNSIEETEEYNCRKYVNYLDCDMFSFDKDNLSGNSQRRLKQALKKSTISKKKQELLINFLNNSNLPNALGENQLYNSNSLITLANLPHLQSKLEHESKGSNFSESRNNLTRVNSQKIIRHSLKSNLEEQQEEDQYQVLTREFLESEKPAHHEIDKGTHLDNNHSEASSKLTNDNEFLVPVSFEDSPEEKDQEEHRFQRSKPSFQFYTELKEEKELTFFKIHSIQTEQQQLQVQEPTASQLQTIEVEDLPQSPTVQQQKIQDVSTLIFNTVVLQALKDIAKSDLLSNSFRAYAKSIRSKIKRSQAGSKKKGFPTDKKEVESFLQSIISYLMEYEPKVFKNLEVPTGPSALQMLRYMHESSHSDSASLCEEEDEANIMVIPNRIFDVFWQLKQKSIIVEVPANFNDSNLLLFKQNIDYLKSFNKIFYRSLFDGLNECLDYARNYGQYGRPFPWKKTPAFAHSLSPAEIQSGIAASRKKMMQLSTTYCGLIIEKDELGELGENEQYITQVQEDRLSRMLASDLIDLENKWIFYDDEEAEILIELSESIYDEIISQVLMEILPC